MTLLQRARPHLKALSERTGETVALAIRDGVYITFVDVVQGQNMVAVRLATGGRLRIANSAAGIALVAALPDAERRSLVSRVRADITRREESPDQFRALLDSCMADGYALVRNTWREGIGGVAVSVRQGDEYAALTIPVATGSVSEADMRATIAAALRDEATAIGPALTAAR
jgi:DNA-binding IclR family transcriptional regulator